MSHRRKNKPKGRHHTHAVKPEIKPFPWQISAVDAAPVQAVASARVSKFRFADKSAAPAPSKAVAA